MRKPAARRGGRSAPPGGSPYSPTNLVVDVVHQAYIIGAVQGIFGSEKAHDLALDLFGQFTCPGGMADSFKFSTKAFQPQPDREMPLIRAVPKGYLLLNQKPARLWSLGEALVLVSMLGEDAQYGAGWLRFGRLLSGWLFDRLENPLDIERPFPRHRMHAAHGLATFLKALRAGA